MNFFVLWAESPNSARFSAQVRTYLGIPRASKTQHSSIYRISPDPFRCENVFLYWTPTKGEGDKDGWEAESGTRMKRDEPHSHQ